MPGKLVVYGAGGHGKVVADAALSSGNDVLGFLDDGVPPASAILTGNEGVALRVLGSKEWLNDACRSGVAVAIAIGDNLSRLKAARDIADLGCALATIIHRSSVVSPYANVGMGTVALAGAVVNPCASVGAGTIINTGAVVEHDVRIGDFAHISPGAVLAGGAKLGKLSHLGACAVVLPGIVVGEQCTVGAGAVVVKDVPDRTVVAGVPARWLRNAARRT